MISAGMYATNIADNLTTLLPCHSMIKHVRRLQNILKRTHPVSRKIMTAA